ncbi:MAG TPA: glutamyl-tRNA reductase [Chthoniobacteraceae bacterium]|jgi:glutamyl-tRNA reductase|nr:glutamyl-tRNA reductase [Chthoniobacteraceae bacterium]
MMDVVCLGLSHQTADVSTRERFAFAEHELGACVGELGRRPELGEALILSTCNRVELYAAAADPAAGFATIEAYLSSRAALEPEDRRFFFRRDGSAAVRHLFRVVSGLESMVLGETEILGQVKRAYGVAVQSGGTARHLNKLFQRSFNVAKEVRTRTNITRGPVSVGSVAVDLAEKIFGRLNSCRAMILGAGETSEMTAKALMSRGAHGIFVSNRSYDRALMLAEETNGEAINFEQWHERFDDIDILISSTSAPHAIVTVDKLSKAMRRRGNRPVFVIDLAVPRDVDPAVNNLDGVYLYDIDALQGIAAHSMNVRRQELTECERLIERHVDEFSGWLANGGRPPAPMAQPVAIESAAS